MNTSNEQKRRFILTLITCLIAAACIVFLVIFLRSESTQPTNVGLVKADGIKGGIGKGSKAFNKKITTFDKDKANNAEEKGDSYMSIPFLQENINEFANLKTEDDCDCDCYRNCKEKDEKEKKREKRIAYDKDGNVIGYIDENGNVIDFNGNIIGKALANGTIIDKNGNIIGKDKQKERKLAYDKDGNVIGYIDENGNVIDKNGNIIGKVLPDGTIVDKNGKVIGETGKRLAYDKDGNVIGYIDENGNVIDKDGNIIGKITPDGKVVNKNGKVIGETGRRLAYDKDGKVIGYIDENGNVIDKDGNIIGKVTPDGTIIDKNGKALGTSYYTPEKKIEEKNPTKEEKKSLVGKINNNPPVYGQASYNEEVEDPKAKERKAREEERKREEVRKLFEKQIKEKADLLATLSVSFSDSAITGGKIDYIKPEEKEEEEKKKEETKEEEEKPAEDTPPAPFNPGDILFAVVDTAINSDIPSSVLATVISQKKGCSNAKLIGEFARFDKRMIVSFSQIIFPDGRIYPIKAYAVDPSTTEASVASEVNTHFFERWGGLVAASFIQGLGEITKMSGAKTSQNALGDEQDKMTFKDYSVKEQLLVAGGKVGEKVSKIFEKGFTRQPTVYLNPGAEIGVLIMEVKKAK